MHIYIYIECSISNIFSIYTNLNLIDLGNPSCLMPSPPTKKLGYLIPRPVTTVAMLRLAELCDQQGPTEVLRSKGVALVPQAFEARSERDCHRWPWVPSILYRGSPYINGNSRILKWVGTLVFVCFVYGFLDDFSVFNGCL